jgi:hypothetical protein
MAGSIGITVTLVSSLWFILRRYQSHWLRAGRLRGRSSSPGRVKNFLFSTSSRPALGSTQPPIQWVQGVLSQGVKWPGCEADHHLQLLPRSRKCESIHPFPHTPSWRSAQSTETTLPSFNNSSESTASIERRLVNKEQERILKGTVVT